MKKIAKFLIPVLIFLMLLAPAISLADFDPARGLVPCNNTPSTNGTIPETEKCDYYAFLKLINILIYFVLYYMAIPIAAIMFVYAGFLLVTAGEEVASARTKAKGIFWNAFLGLVIAAAAWLIVKTLLSILGYKDLEEYFKVVYNYVNEIS